MGDMSAFPVSTQLLLSIHQRLLPVSMFNICGYFCSPLNWCGIDFRSSECAPLSDCFCNKMPGGYGSGLAGQRPQIHIRAVKHYKLDTSQPGFPHWSGKQCSGANSQMPQQRPPATQTLKVFSINLGIRQQMLPCQFSSHTKESQYF